MHIQVHERIWARRSSNRWCVIFPSGVSDRTRWMPLGNIICPHGLERYFLRVSATLSFPAYNHSSLNDFHHLLLSTAVLLLYIPLGSWESRQRCICLRQFLKAPLSISWQSSSLWFSMAVGPAPDGFGTYIYHWLSLVWKWNTSHFLQVSPWLRGAIPGLVSFLRRFGPAMMETVSSERAAHIVEAVAGCLRDPEVRTKWAAS